MDFVSKVFDWDNYKTWFQNESNTKKLSSAALTATKIAGVLTLIGIGNKVYDQYYYRKRNNYPPGPTGLPLIGSIFSVLKGAKAFRAHLQYMSDEYGPISMCYLGNQPAIFINDYNFIKKLFNMPEFTNRRDNESPFKPHSILESSMNDPSNPKGKFVKERRKLMLRALIAQARRSDRLYSLISDAITSTFKKIDQCILENKKWDIRHEAKFITFSSVYASMIGEKMKVNDPLLMEFFQSTEEFFTPSILLGLLVIFMKDSPFRASLIDTRTTMGRARANCIRVSKKWIEKKRSKIQSQLDNTNNNNNDDNKDIEDNNIIDESDYLLQLLVANKEGKLSEDEMCADIFVAFLAGTHTTSVAIEQAILWLAKYPNLQTNLYNEIINNIGSNDIKLLSDIKNYNKCPKLKAFIHEVLRNHALISSTIRRVWKPQHCNKIIEYKNPKTNKIEKYYFPPNSAIFSNTWDMNHNSKDFPTNSNQFDPTLSNYLTTKKNDENNSDNLQFNEKQTLAVFGAGLRDCLGQSLAKNELYMVLGILIANYQFNIPDNISKDEFEIPLYWQPEPKKLGVKCSKRNIH